MLQLAFQHNLRRCFHAKENCWSRIFLAVVLLFRRRILKNRLNKRMSFFNKKPWVVGEFNVVNSESNCFTVSSFECFSQAFWIIWDDPGCSLTAGSNSKMSLRRAIGYFFSESNYSNCECLSVLFNWPFRVGVTSIKLPCLSSGVIFGFLVPHSVQTIEK